MNQLIARSWTNFLVVIYGLFILLIGWGSPALISAEPPAWPTPIELSSEQMVKLVDGLSETDSEKYSQNLVAVENALKTARNPLPFSKLLLVRLEEYKEKPNLSLIVRAQTNHHIADITSELFLLKRKEQPQDCSQVISYIGLLSAYQREKDATLFLEELKTNALQYPPQAFSPWNGCSYHNGTFGALADALLATKQEKWLTNLFALYEGYDIERKQAIQARLVEADPAIKSLARNVIASKPFKNLRHELEPHIAATRGISYILMNIHGLKLVEVSEFQNHTNWSFKLAQPISMQLQTSKDLKIELISHPSEESAKGWFDFSNATRARSPTSSSRPENGTVHKWEYGGPNQWFALIGSYCLEIRSDSHSAYLEIQSVFERFRLLLDD